VNFFLPVLSTWKLKQITEIIVSTLTSQLFLVEKETKQLTSTKQNYSVIIYIMLRTLVLPQATSSKNARPKLPQEPNYKKYHLSLLKKNIQNPWGIGKPSSITSTNQIQTPIGGKPFDKP